MKILKKEKWWVWLLCLLGTKGISNFILGALLDVYEKDAWYSKWYYWVLAFVCLILPGIIMFYVFSIQILCEIGCKLNIPGEEIYATPYTWLLCLIIPVIGWIFFIVMVLYLEIWIIVMLYRGEGEKYIK